MRKIKILLLRKRHAYLFCSSLVLLTIWLFLLGSMQFDMTESTYEKTSKTIIIDPGHGGIDGGTNKDGLLEKDINLDVSKKLKELLIDMGYRVILTREEDISLDHLSDASRSRHQRDLNTRVQMINDSNARLFLSIHVNCNVKKPSTDGGIVFYQNRFSENKEIAYALQRALNSIEINGVKRTVHEPVHYDKYYLLNQSKIPGVIVEMAFISNAVEHRLLEGSAFREQLAKAIAEGLNKYLMESEKVMSSDSLLNK